MIIEMFSFTVFTATSIRPSSPSEETTRWTSSKSPDECRPFCQVWSDLWSFTDRKRTNGRRLSPQSHFLTTLRYIIREGCLSISLSISLSTVSLSLLLPFQQLSNLFLSFAIKVIAPFSVFLSPPSSSSLSMEFKLFHPFFGMFARCW